MRYRDIFPRFCCVLLLGLMLSSCAGTPDTVSQKALSDQQWFRSMETGRDAFDQGYYLLASHLFQQALERGRQMDRAGQIADAAFNLAAARIELGSFAAADRSLQEAKSESHRQGGPVSELLLLEAKLARLQTETMRSRAITNRLLQQLPENDHNLRPQALLLSGMLACEAVDGFLAEQELAKAVALLGNAQHPALAATQSELQGCIKLLQGSQLEAAGDFDHESSYLQQARHYRQMVNALQRAGTAYVAAGENHLGADRLFRAARSAFSQKRLKTAQLLLDKAESAAITADSRLLLLSIAQLRAEIAERKKSPKQNQQ